MQQVRVKNRLHEAVMEYSEDTVLWFKHKTGITLDPWQIVLVNEIESNPKSIVVWPPRFGKTFAMEAVDLKELCCNAYERIMIFGPTRKQAINALKEHLDWLEMSPILKNMVAFKRGKKQLSESKYELRNKSQAECFGINSAFDSENATILRGEEWDDMNTDIWVNRVLARGGRKNKSGLPLRVRLSGTIQFGNGPIRQYDIDPSYQTVTKFDIYDGLAWGIYDEEAIAEIRDKYTTDQWLRIYLLKFTDTKNFIWETALRKCLQKSIEMNWVGVDYVPDGPKHKPRGMVYAGYDCGHSGEGRVHSVYRLEIVEVIGETVLWLYGQEWESTIDPAILKKEVCDIWEFYGVSDGYGDALKNNDISDMNNMLLRRGAIENDRSEYPENKPAHWNHWNFAPQWNNGKNKYLWAGVTKTKVDNCQLIIPYFEHKDDRPIAVAARRLLQALVNIRLVLNNTAHPSFEIIDAHIGDDPFDAINMALGCVNDRNEVRPDFGLIKMGGGRTVTSGLSPSVLNEFGGGVGGSYADFMKDH